MPRFYIFTVVFSMVLGILTYKFVTVGTNLWELLTYISLWCLIWVNEKTAFFENLIPDRYRKWVGLVLALLLALLLLWSNREWFYELSASLDTGF